MPVEELYDLGAGSSWIKSPVSTTFDDDQFRLDIFLF
jgi:hypothetical protein